MEHLICSIGFSPTPLQKKVFWEKVCKGVTNWTLLGGPFTKVKAHNLAKRLSRQYGPQSLQEEDDPDDGSTSWYVYYFEHECRKSEMKDMNCEDTGRGSRYANGAGMGRNPLARFMTIPSSPSMTP
jgi:hypothetical protein